MTGIGYGTCAIASIGVVASSVIGGVAAYQLASGDCPQLVPSHTCRTVGPNPIALTTGPGTVLTHQCHRLLSLSGGTHHYYLITHIPCQCIPINTVGTVTGYQRTLTTW